MGLVIRFSTKFVVQLLPEFGKPLDLSSDKECACLGVLALYIIDSQTKRRPSDLDSFPSTSVTLSDKVSSPPPPLSLPLFSGPLFHVKYVHT